MALDEDSYNTGPMDGSLMFQKGERDGTTVLIKAFDDADGFALEHAVAERLVDNALGG